MECKIHDISLFYEIEGNGIPILLLHGQPLDHRHMMSDFEPVLSKRNNWCRIYPDMPGMGKTKAADWIVNQDQMLDILIQFIDNVIADNPFVVVGTSFGGYLARGLVHRRGKQMLGIMLNVPCITPDKLKLNLPQHRVLHDDKTFIDELRSDEQDLKNVVVSQSLDLLYSFRKNIAPAQEIANHDFIQKLRKNFTFSFDVDSLPEPFPAPALILTGREDNWCGYRESFQFIDNYPRATYAAMDCAGHFLSSEQQELFRLLVDEWLNRVEEYARGSK